MQKFTESLKDINKAIAINSYNSEYFILRAYLYKVFNDKDAMHTDAQKARQLGANVPEDLFE